MAGREGRPEPLAGTAFALRDPYPWGHLAGLARIGESVGYGALFIPEVGSRDVLVTLNGLAGETGSLLLGSGVLPLPARSSRLLAKAAATVQERSGGRLLLGIGTGPAAPGVLDRLRSTVAMLRAALAGDEATTPEGERFPPGLVPETPPPIWIAALGPKAVRLAGEVGDGVLLNWCTPERVARAAAQIAESASTAGRDPASVTIGVYVRGCLGAEESLALEALRVQAGAYAAIPHYRRQMEAFGLGDPARRAADAIERGRPDEVPEELVRALCLLGDAGAAKARLEEFRAAGAAVPVVYPVPVLDPPSSIMSTMLAVAPSTVLQP
jgi:alkanesulfonate monooxygenase SsuD/methylene tetrahydromethanopterin reductase-like flavin-dependent oxidoreductase (luciferase family)